MIVLRLGCSAFWVDVRLASLGLGSGAVEAIEAALEPFEGLVDELMASLASAAIR
jgi:hypothetical protein